MRVQLFVVGMEDKETNEKIRLKVWAKNCDDATHKCCSILFGVEGAYRWTGTGPIYKNNEVVTKEVKER